jgi:glycogenin
MAPETSGHPNSRLLPEPSMRAYCSLLSTESYLPGVLALHQSLKRTGTAYPFVTAVSAHIAPQIDPLLQAAGIIVRRIPESTAIPKEMIENNGHWGHTFDKVHLFGLYEFDKLVYVDSDMIVLANMDELFDKPHMSAVPAGVLVHSDWTRLNGGLLVIEPEEHLADRIFATLPQALAEVAAMGLTASGDQDLLNAYYPAWRTTPSLHLDQGYNMFQCYLDLHIEEHGFQLPAHFSKSTGDSSKHIKTVHFIGPLKPWMKGAVLRQYWRVLKNGRGVKWEHRLFSDYKKMLADSRPRNDAFPAWSRVGPS